MRAGEGGADVKHLVMRGGGKGAGAEAVRGGGGAVEAVELGWVVACTGGRLPRPVCPSLTGSTPPYPVCLVSRPSRLLTTSEPHQGTGGGEMPPCLCVSTRWGPGGGGGSQGRGTPVLFSSRPWLARVWGCKCPVLRAPSAGHWCPTTRLLMESMGLVTSSFLQPTTEPQRGARGVWSEVLLD